MFIFSLIKTFFSLKTHYIGGYVVSGEDILYNNYIYSEPVHFSLLKWDMCPFFMAV